MAAPSERRTEFKRQFGNFLDQFHKERHENTLLTPILAPANVKNDKLRLGVDLHDLRDFNVKLLEDLLKAPEDCIPPFEEALDEYVRNAFPKTLKEGQRVRIGFTGEFGRNRVSPRNLSAELISALVNLEGIVTKCSLVRPKLVTSVHYCEATGQFTHKQYRDAAALEGMPTGSAYPTHDESGNPLTTEFGLSTYANHQVITVQELPETAPAGQLPRSAEVTLEDDLVDSCKPGDRVNLVGVYKALPPRAQNSISGNFRAILLANSVRQLNEAVGRTAATVDEMRSIEKLVTQPGALDQIAKSLAPSIYGHDTIKKGLLLLLLGGRERVLENGTHLRGDINCLLVGDPGVAKSQMLRAVMNVAPLAVSTTGKGSSGVGLTAAVTHDKDTGERKLEAGAMVLADRGIVCIDEFDKMNDLDRVAIHEVMEQQTVTIAKAGIQMSLNARCSVLAAANPLYGSFDPTMSITRNVNLPDSLLSRFDLLFVVTDNLTSEQDRKIAMHVMGQHRYRQAGDDGRSVLTDAQARQVEETEDEVMDTQDEDEWMYCKRSNLLHASFTAGGKPPLSVKFLKKYLSMARRRGSDLALTDEAMEMIGDYYTELRSGRKDSALPVTVRTLETIIRLATAAAKARLAGEGVEAQDVTVAIDLIKAMLNTNLAAAPGEDGVEVEDADVDGEAAQAAGHQRAAPQPSAAQAPPTRQTRQQANQLPGPLMSPRSRRARRRSTGSLSSKGGASERSNNENDTSENVQARGVRAVGRGSGAAPLGEAAGPSEQLSDEQLALVSGFVRKLLLDRGFQGSVRIIDVKAAMAEDGHDLSEAFLTKAAQALAAAYEHDPDSAKHLPISYDAGVIYEC